ncbi:hypothetical protein [Serinicoccus sp. LYQ131]|uniref:hypothetical protein n=1 Tax=Serinicoccus sp. LYQ131 TaxID=3378797 RepID=UPI003853DEC9
MVAVICAVGAVGLLSACQETPAIVEVWGTADGQELDVGVGTCEGNPTVTAVGTADEVRLSASMARSFSPFATTDCGTLRTVTLEEPLGDRQVVNDATGEQLEVLGSD